MPLFDGTDPIDWIARTEQYFEIKPWQSLFHWSPQMITPFIGLGGWDNVSLILNGSNSLLSYFYNIKLKRWIISILINLWGVLPSYLCYLMVIFWDFFERLTCENPSSLAFSWNTRFVFCYENLQRGGMWDRISPRLATFSVGLLLISVFSWLST